MKGLTERQEEIYSYLVSSFIKTSKIPRLSEIADDFSINKRSAYETVSALIAKGYLKKKGNGDLLLSDSDRLHLINTAIPCFKGDERKSYISLEEASLGPSFSFIIGSDEMRNIGLMQGDEAVFVKTDSARNGDIVLCSVEDGDVIMLRRLFIRPDGLYELIPENDTMGKTTANKVIIYGRLIMSRRRYIE